MLEFDSIQPVEKGIRRIDLKGWPENSMMDNFQILVSIGIHVNNRTMAMVNQERFHADYLTVYVRGEMTPVSSGLKVRRQHKLLPMAGGQFCMKLPNILISTNSVIFFKEMETILGSTQRFQPPAV
jgi:hypothetical protein